jgi:hypothetical protein
MPTCDHQDESCRAHQHQQRRRDRRGELVFDAHQLEAWRRRLRMERRPAASLRDNRGEVRHRGFDRDAFTQSRDHGGALPRVRGMGQRDRKPELRPLIATTR